MATGLGVGGAIASGIQSGFEMGRQLDNDALRRSQIERENRRQDDADALAASDMEAANHDHLIAGLAQQYGGVEKIPQTVADQLTSRAQQIYMQRSSVLQQRMQPVIQREKQWADDTSSRLATGQLKWEQLSPADKVRLIENKTQRPITDFFRDDSGQSHVGQGIADSTAGLQTGNHGLLAQGASTLLHPELNQNLGERAPDGSVITGKSIAAFVPAPANPAAAAPPPPSITSIGAGIDAAAAQMQPTPGNPVAQGVPPQTPDASRPLGTPPPPAPQGEGLPGTTPAAPPAPPALAPGENPDAVMPVLRVDTLRPDGTTGSYHAPVTVGRGTDGTIAPPTSVSDLMNHMGQLGTVEAFVNQPGVRADLEAGLKTRGGSVPQGSLLASYYALNGKPGDLTPQALQNTVGQRVQAIEYLKKQGLTEDQALAEVDGRAAQMQSRINQAIALYPGSDPQSTQMRNTLVRDILLGAAGRTTGLIQKPLDPNSPPLTAAALDDISRAALKDRTALVGLGRDPGKISQVLNHMAEISHGGDLAASRALYGADKKSLEKFIPQYDAITSFENNALTQGQRLVELANKVDTTGVPVIERWIRAGRSAVAGDPDVTAFNTQLGIFAPEVAKILTNPNLTGVLTDQSQKEVQKFLPDSLTAGQADRVVKLLTQDFASRHASIENQVQEIVDRMAKRGTPEGEKPGARAALTGGTPGVTGNPANVTEQPGSTDARTQILNDELAAATGRLKDAQAKGDQQGIARAQSDIATTQKELSKPVGPGVAGALGARPTSPPPQQALPGSKPPAAIQTPAAAPKAPITATGPGGKKLQLVNGQWVPLQ